MIIEIGLQGHAETLVEKEDTAQAVGSGGLLVYATPCLAALMEGAAYESIAPFLAEGESTVGTRMDVKHLSATPVGMEVRAESVVTAAGSAAPVVVVVSATAVAMPKSLVRNSMRISSFR